MNNTTNTCSFLNAQLHTYLTAFSNSLPHDAAWDNFKILIESIKFALLSGESPIRLSKRIRRERHHKEPSLIPLSSHQAKIDIIEVKRLRALAKTKSLIPGKHKLDAYRQEIVILYQNGASQTDIKYWLTANKNMVVSQSTIHRYLASLCHEPINA